MVFDGIAIRVGRVVDWVGAGLDSDLCLPIVSRRDTIGVVERTEPIIGGHRQS